jgi:hypothetical protein
MPNPPGLDVIRRRQRHTSGISTDRNAARRNCRLASAIAPYRRRERLLWSGGVFSQYSRARTSKLPGFGRTIAATVMGSLLLRVRAASILNLGTFTAH